MVGKEVFYAALWGSVLVSPAIRLPASLFVVGHISRDSPGKEQKYMLGTDYQLTVGALLLTRVERGTQVPASWAQAVTGAAEGLRRAAGKGRCCKLQSVCALLLSKTRRRLRGVSTQNETQDGGVCFQHTR